MPWIHGSHGSMELSIRFPITPPMIVALSAKFESEVFLYLAAVLFKTACGIENSASKKLIVGCPKGVAARPSLLEGAACLHCLRFTSYFVFCSCVANLSEGIR